MERPVRMMSVCVAAAALIAFAPLAAAKTKAVRPAPPQNMSEPEIIEEAPPQRVCAKLCETDMSPCDPPYMKNSDARCSNPGTTIGF